MKQDGKHTGCLDRSEDESQLKGALVQVGSVLGSVQALRTWDPEGWRQLRAACLDLQKALARRLDEVRGSGVSKGEGAGEAPDIDEALVRIRLQLERLSLPKAAWECWWATACRLKLLEARLQRGQAASKTAVA